MTRMQQPSTHSPFNEDPMYILVVDDLADNRDLLISLMEEKQLGKCIEASNGREALELLHKGQRVDLVLLDINMPGLNGYEVLQYLQGHRSYYSIPIIMVTAQNDRESALHCIEAGASDYIAKPVEESLLRARVRNCLERKRLHDREEKLLLAIQKEKGKVDELLGNMLPRSVAERLKAGEERIADNLELVTVIFMDLAGFTSYGQQLEASELVRFLDTLYAEFDRLSHVHGVEKIKTMGDGYMAVSGIAQGQKDHAQRCLDFGREATRATAALCEQAKAPLALRTGICSGPVVAGILGTLRSTFDIWGDTVNIAFRMQEHCQPGCILLAPSSYDLITPPPNASRLPPITVKGGGTMQAWSINCL